MKKLILILSAIVISFAVYSQDSKDGVISGGLYFGQTTSWLTTDTKIIKPEGTKMGFNFGATMDLKITSNFYFNLGLGYNNCGGKIKYIYGAHEFKSEDWEASKKLEYNSIVKYRTNFLEFPVSFKGKTNEIAYTSYYMKAGITPMLRLKSKADLLDSGTLSEDNLLISKYTSFFNLGWHIGGGGEYALVENTKIFAELVFTGGILDYDKTYAYSQFEDPANNHLTEDKKIETPFRATKTLVNNIQIKIGILF